MAVVKINLSCELTEAVKVQYIRGNLFSQDNQANVINVAVFEGGEPTELAGTVTANVIRPDGGTVAVTGGTFEGNVATITMPSAVYAIPGMISVAVKITLDSVVTTIAAFAATVYATSTDTAVDPGTIIPSIQTLIAEIEAAVDSIPADYSSLWATLAPNYSNLTFPVAVGQYCTYDGGFYRCNTAIATQEAWTAAHWTATNIGADLAETRLDVANLEDDVSELKSAIGTVPTGKTVQGQIEALQTGKADMIVVTDSTPAAVMSFPDGADGQPMKLEVAIDPVQDLHGYDYPWPAGGGKNLLEITFTSDTINGITATINDDGTVSFTGTATDNADFTLNSAFVGAGDGMILSGCPSGGSSSTYRLVMAGGYNDSGSGVSIPANTSGRVYFRIYSGTTVNNLVVKPMIRLASKTDATFAPYTNICPISGWTGAKVTRTGKNLFDYDSIRNITLPDGNVRNGWKKDLKAGTYTISRGGGNVSGYVMFEDDTAYSFTANTSRTLTINKDKTLYFWVGTNASLSDIEQIQVEFGSTATAYEESINADYPISWQTEAGTVYGGTLTVNKDGSGKLVVDRVTVDLGNYSWNRTTIASGDYIFGTTNLNNRMPGINELICSSYKYIPGGRGYLSEGDCAITSYNTNNSPQVVVRDDRYSSAEDFADAVDGVKLCYILAEGSVSQYTITAVQMKSLLGLNNIWADTGNINSVEYSANTKLYIDGKIADAIANILNA